MRDINHSWLMGAGVLALALLAGCEPKPPVPKVGPAAAALPSAVNATAAVILNDTPVPQSSRPPEVSALDEEASLDSLRTSLGKSPHEGINYLEHGVLAQRLRRLLGHDYPLLLRNMQAATPLTKAGALWYVTGQRPHEGASELAAVVIDPRRNALRVWLQSAGLSWDFVDPPTAQIAWPEAVRSLRGNAVPQGK